MQEKSSRANRASEKDAEGEEGMEERERRKERETKKVAQREKGKSAVGTQSITYYVVSDIWSSVTVYSVMRVLRSRTVSCGM